MNLSLTGGQRVLIIDPGKGELLRFSPDNKQTYPFIELSQYVPTFSQHQCELTIATTDFHGVVTPLRSNVLCVQVVDLFFKRERTK
jgi:hypothetical protein